jgi:hypothetical protein
MAKATLFRHLGLGGLCKRLPTSGIGTGTLLQTGSMWSISHVQRVYRPI